MNLVPIFELDRGGMGTVSVAARVEGSFVRYFAVKRLLPELRADAAQRAMFIEEARIAGALVHPNVVPVIDVGEDRDGPYLVMEYVDGVSAAACIKALRALRQTLPVGVAVLVARDVMRGVAAAHEATDAEGRALGIVHRDLSPQNVLIDFAGRARVTDFGIARAAGGDHHTRTGVLK
ncbi:MAG: serine/threonine-protein kinase, partial [Myxococcota bacterium]